MKAEKNEKHDLLDTEFIEEVCNLFCILNYLLGIYRIEKAKTWDYLYSKCLLKLHPKLM